MESRPDVLGLKQNPVAIGVPRARRGLVPLLGEEGQEQIADHRADVEADRPDEGEFRIDDPRVVASSA